MKTVILNNHKDESLRRFHPWVFSGAIKRFSEQPQEGELVKVVSAQGETMGVGHFANGSIAVRMLNFFTDALPDNFFEQRFQSALKLRQNCGLITENNNTYRLVHGEGDFLPGLVIDIYDDTAVVQAHSTGMHLLKNDIAQALMQTVPNLKNVYYKSEGTLPYLAKSGEVKDEYIVGEPSSCLGKENGLLFGIDWLRGQKTGFFIDQRENRALVERYALNKRVLNMFCYTGGFSVYALRGGALKVDSVDSSAKAIQLVDENVKRNFGNCLQHKSFVDDAFRFLDASKEQYDLIILDPPAFAKHRGAIKNALRAYQRINAKAFEMLPQGGLLFTFSCSQAVSKEMFRLAAFSAAAEAKRNVRILHQLTQPQDHPINIYHPEGEYLKGLVLEVD